MLACGGMTHTPAPGKIAYKAIYKMANPSDTEHQRRLQVRLESCVRKDDARGARALLAQGTDPQQALFYAAFRGSCACLRLLLEHGADPTAANHLNQTPLICAASRNRHDAVVALTPFGHLDHSDSEAGTALAWAAVYCAENTAKHLLEAGADPNALCSGASRPLIEAAASGHAGIMKLLLDAGADPTALDAQGRGILHCAAASESEEALCLAASVLSDRLDAPDFDGRTPLHHAIESSSPDCAAFLLRLGASIDIPHPCGQMPEAIARQNELFDCAAHIEALRAARELRLCSNQPPACGARQPRI